MATRYAPPVHGANDEPATRVLLHIACQNLLDLDTFSVSDPQCFVQMQPRAGVNEWVTVGSTEAIDNDLNPRFTTAIPVDYFFERVQKIRFIVVDVDDRKKSRWEEHELIGILETTVGGIIGARGGCLTGPLENLLSQATLKGGGKDLGTIMITAEETTDTRVIVRLRLSARHVDKKDWFGKSDPFLVISKGPVPGAQHWIKVHQTEVVKKTLDPVWRPFEISASKLNGGDMDRLLRFEVFDWDKRTSPDFIGMCEFSLSALEKNPEGPLINAKKAKKKKEYVDSGLLRLDGVELRQEHTFVDFIRGGCQLNMAVAIDFTHSNGEAQNPTSLHYRSPYGQNEYETAIHAVTSILAPYDWDGKYPVFGFGAKLPDGQVSHHFPLNGKPDDPEVRGVDGIIEAYHMAMKSVELNGPTNFAPTIRKAMQFAKQIKMGEGYFVLLILTDGVITDLDTTVDTIVEASFLPMSIVIVGVGGANFDTMEVLDADDGALRASDGTLACRDIVQFVPFRAFASGDLAAEVLRELPEQVVEFFKIHHVEPRRALSGNERSTDSTSKSMGKVAAPPPYTP